jgi:hypothetical protein
MHRRVAAHLALISSILASAPCGSFASEPAAAPSRIDLAGGIAVIALGKDSADDAWDLATRVYLDPLLRPASLQEPTARVLAGEQPAPRSSPALTELASVRSSLNATRDPANLRLLDSVADGLHVSAVLLVVQAAPGRPRAKLRLAHARDFIEPDLWKQPDSAQHPSWQPAIGWLHAHAMASRRAQAQPPGPQSSNLLTSPWFWGALGAAATAAIVVYAVGRDDSPSSIHLQGRVGP